MRFQPLSVPIFLMIRKYKSSLRKPFYFYVSLCVERIFSRLAEERQDKQPRQRQTFWLMKLAKADGHAFVAPCRLILICAQKAVPPWEIKPKSTIMFLDNHRMVYSVHLWRDDQESQHTVDSIRQSDIAVIEHAGSVKKHLKKDYTAIAEVPNTITAAILMPMDRNISMGWKRTPVVTSKSRSVWCTLWRRQKTGTA